MKRLSALLANGCRAGLLLLGVSNVSATFTDVATQAGLNVVAPPPVEDPFPAGIDRYTSGYASCAVDIDRDGWTDLILAQNPRRCLVFINNRNGTFREEGISRGFETAVDIGGIAAGDFSNTGRTDVFMVPRNGPSYLLFVNDGTGHFTEQAVTRGADSTVTGEVHRGQSIGLVDFNRDGFLDLHVTEWGVSSTADDAKYSVLLRNRGQAAPGFFDNVTQSSGLRQPHIGSVMHGYSSAWADFDGDGYPDLSLVSDFGKSQLWWNNGNGTFTEGRQEARVGTDQNGMGVAVADFDRDGRLDFIVSSFDFGTGETVRTPFGANRLYRNLGGRKFEDVVTQYGGADGSWAWGTAFLDANNDSRADLIITNGYFYEGPPSTSLRPFRISNAKTDRTRFYVGNEFGFNEVGESWGVTDHGYGRSVTVLDYDNDGDEDVLISTLYGPWILYRNDTPAPANRWLRLSFRGTSSNRDGYGTVVRATAAGVTQTALYAPTNAYLGQREPFLHFGLGAAAVVETLVVEWPNGAVQTLSAVPANQVLNLVEPTITTNAPPLLTLLPVGGTYEKDVDVVLTAAATGTPQPIFTWFKDGVAVPGVNGPVLALKRIHPFDGGTYSVTASNPLGTAPGGAAQVRVTANLSRHSTARWWNEALLDGIRKDTPNPPVHARNLYHLSAALWDAFWAYEPETRAGAGPAYRRESPAVADLGAGRIEAQKQAMSHAAYQIIAARFARSPGAARTLAGIRWLMELHGFNPDDVGTVGNTPAAVGNRIGLAVLAATFGDGANEANGYADATSYVSVNAPLVVGLPGTTMVDPNRWQPLSLSYSITQNGIVLPSGLQRFVGVNARLTEPFALVRSSPNTLFLDPGPPPQLGGDRSNVFVQEVVEVIRYSSYLDPADPARVDISPRTSLNHLLGTNQNRGYEINPVTGLAYAANLVSRADFGRVLAEYWADGPNSETPPGHWNVIFNEVSDAPGASFRLGGVGPELSRLEWDVRGYYALNGSLHDAACAAWTIKRLYDGVRPISMVRYMGGLGQGTDPAGPRYHPQGLPLIPDLIEMTTAETVAPGGRHASILQRRDTSDDLVGKVVVRAWLGNPADPVNQVGGVGWMLASRWVPYQMSTFVTPAFPGYVSGHSTFSRTAAEVLTLLRGDPFYPGGLSSYSFRNGKYLTFERGPGEDLTLQWATFYDAADQAGLSRLYGGIHVSSDDLTGRRLGSRIGLEGFLKAQAKRTEAAADARGALVNLSTRGVSGTGEKVLIAGFVVGSGVSQDVLVRSVGPALANFGLLADRCAPDPSLVVFRSGATNQPVLTNDQWGESPRGEEIAAKGRAVGAFALPTGSRDAAELLTTEQGTYTVTAPSGASVGTLVQLVEIYGQRLTNVSSRGFVARGDGALIAGFTVAGTEPVAILIRGIGPSLAPLGVTGVLADPVVRLHRMGGPGGAEWVAENDDWATDARASLVASATGMVGAFPIAAGTTDSALFVQLMPGSYTVTLFGKADTEGVGLVEVYHVR
ncbi:MAG: FG-GAP-like repeat-containing protein [Opitutaceae bacterium]